MKISRDRMTLPLNTEDDAQLLYQTTTNCIPKTTFIVGAASSGNSIAIKQVSLANHDQQTTSGGGNIAGLANMGLFVRAPQGSDAGNNEPRPKTSVVQQYLCSCTAKPIDECLRL